MLRKMIPLFLGCHHLNSLDGNNADMSSPHRIHRHESADERLKILGGGGTQPEENHS